MAVRARFRIEAGVSSSSAELKDLGRLVMEVVTDGFNEGGTRKFRLAGGATNVTLALGNVAVGGAVLIRTTSDNPNDPVPDVEILLNGGVEPLLIRPVPDAKEGHFLLTTDSITSISASNLGTTVVSLTLLFVGD